MSFVISVLSSMQAIIQEIRARFWNLPQEVEARARARRNRYMRVYMREVYRKRRRRVSVTLVPDEYRRMKEHAGKSGRALATFVREAALAYIERRYLVPKNLEQTLWQLTRQLRAVGNNLNQMAHHVNTRKKTSLSELRQARSLLQHMEMMVYRSVACPQEAHDH